MCSQNAENVISEPLNYFKNFLGDMPRDPPRGH